MKYIKEANFTSAEQLAEICRNNYAAISDVMFSREINESGRSADEVLSEMKNSLAVMKNGVEHAKAGGMKTLGGYIGGEGKALLNGELMKSGKSLCGIASRAAAYAMGMIELNASMGRIVAAPTAGSCGIIPGVVMALKEEFDFSDEKLTVALFNAGAIGYLFARNATISGAEGGCQSEVGVACAMAASAVVELFGGSVTQCLAAAGDTISNILGLVCDPISGLVEAPCQKRNALGAANALLCAEIALSDDREPLVSLDQIIKISYSVGKSIPYQLRETALGGMASADINVKRCRHDA